MTAVLGGVDGRNERGAERSASRLAATATSQSWPWTMSKSCPATNSRPRSSRSWFILPTHCTNSGSAVG